MPEGNGVRFPSRVSSPLLSAWLGAMVGGQLALCPPPRYFGVFPTVLLLRGCPCPLHTPMAKCPAAELRSVPLCTLALARKAPLGPSVCWAPFQPAAEAKLHQMEQGWSKQLQHRASHSSPCKKASGASADGGPLLLPMLEEALCGCQGRFVLLHSHPHPHSCVTQGLLVLHLTYSSPC